MMDLSNLSADEKVFCAHVDDLAVRCEKRYEPQYTAFLDERQAALAQLVLRRAGWEDFLLYGGYDGASRAVLAVFPPYAAPELQDFPLRAVTFSFRQEDTLTHRDFLGSLMALQLKREAIGDILVEPGRAVVFLTPPAAALALAEVKKVGSVGVKPSDAPPQQLPSAGGFEDITGTVSSLRLDSVAALAAGISREKAAQLIRSGLVSVEFASCQDTDHPVSIGDRLGIRGFGKYKVAQQGGLSKKGRVHLLIQKYT